MTSGALVIAAGFSRRFGSDKRVFQLKHEPLLIATLRSYRAAFANVAVVVRSSDSTLTRLIGESFGRQLPVIVPTSHAHLGMGASIADGIRAVVDWDYVFLGLGDMPYIRPETLRTLKSTMDKARLEREPCLVVPMIGDTAGHPVGFSREYFAELIALTGDRGARSVVEAHANEVRRVLVDDPGIVTDIDHPPM